MDIGQEDLALPRLRHWETTRPDVICMTQPMGDGSLRAYTWSQAVGEARRMAAWLRAQEYPEGSNIAIISKNCAHWMMCDWAIWMAGHVSVPLYPTLTAESVRKILEHSESRAAFIGKLDDWDSMKSGVPDGVQCIGFPLSPPNDFPTWDAIIAEQDPLTELPERRAEDLATIIYTSGTTGMPKGVMLTHRNLLFIGGRSGTSRRVTPGDRIYGVLPISHVFGLASVYLGNMYMGGQVDLIPRFRAVHAIEAIEIGTINLFNGVPQMYARMLEQATIRGRSIDSGRLRYLSCGGAPLDLGLKQRVEAMFGLPLHNGYGMTETSPTIAVTDIDRPRDDDTVGEIIPDVAVRIVDDAGASVSAGMVGEIQVAGPLIMKGYYKAPVETAAVMDGDWFKTGDLGRITEDGLVYVVGRKKELIIRSGFNVYPPEVEAAISLHPDVALCAVVGRLARDGNEDVVAFVQPVAGLSLIHI